MRKNTSKRTPEQQALWTEIQAKREALKQLRADEDRATRDFMETPPERHNFVEVAQRAHAAHHALLRAIEEIAVMEATYTRMRSGEPG